MKVSTGLGKLKDYHVKLKIDLKDTPIVQPGNRISINRQQPIDELDKTEEKETIQYIYNIIKNSVS